MDNAHEAKSFKSLQIADYFILRSKQDEKGISNKKLQKLLYYSQAWSLVLRNKPIFEDDIEAWVHGPAIKRVYLAFKEYGFDNITKEVSQEKIDSSLTDDEKRFLDSVWKVYGKYDAAYLETLSHSESPWQEAREDLADFESSTNTITHESMKTYYGQKIQRN